MLGIGRVTCVVCKTRGRRREARKAQDGSGAHICAACYAQWETTGRKCAACNTSVKGVQDVGLLLSGQGLGHADCGGARLLRA
jgi:hypothetical protein